MKSSIFFQKTRRSAAFFKRVISSKMESIERESVAGCVIFQKVN